MTAIFHPSNGVHRGFGRLVQIVLSRFARTPNQAARHDASDTLTYPLNDKSGDDTAMAARVDMLLRFFEREHTQGAGRF